MKRGSARETRPGRWELKVYIRRDPVTNRKVYRYETVDAGGQREADALLVEFCARVLPDKKPKAGRRTVGELLEAWFAARSHEWKAGTEYNARTRINGSLSALADKDVLDVDVEVLDEFYRRLRTKGGAKGTPLKVATVARLRGDLKLAFDYGVSIGFGGLRANPVIGTKPGRERKHRIVPPTKDEVVALLAAAEEHDPEWLCYMMLGAETGARRGELAVLRLSDFGDDEVRIERNLVVGLDTEENRARYEGHCWPSDWARGKVRTMLIEDMEPKTEDSVRPLALSPMTMELVHAQARRLVATARDVGVTYQADGFLFPATIIGDRPLRVDGWTHRFDKLRVELGLKSVRLHDIRHFVVTTLLVAKHDLATVAGIAGHGGGGKTTLAIYAGFMKEPARAANEFIADLLRPAPAADANVVQMAGRKRRKRA